jgi:hypothetical protein
VRGDVHTNTIEGYFSVFKRGMKGIYQHCGEAHLHRYLSEFDFRYTTPHQAWLHQRRPRRGRVARSQAQAPHLSAG